MPINARIVSGTVGPLASWARSESSYSMLRAASPNTIRSNELDGFAEKIVIKSKRLGINGP